MRYTFSMALADSGPVGDTVPGVAAVVSLSVFAAVALEPWRADLWWPCDVAVQEAFVGFLRPGELWRFLRLDVRLPGTRSLLTTSVVVFAIREAKNRHFAGRLQFRAVRASEAARWLNWLLEEASPETMTWPHGPRYF